MGRRVARFVLAGVSMCAVVPVLGGAHTWDVAELFSNASGTIQFVELVEANGGTAENGVGSAGVRSLATGKLATCPNVAGNTAFRRYLVGTPGFAALPGAPTLNCTLSGANATNFFSTVADTVRYGPPYDDLTFATGVLPLDGLRSLTDAGAGKATPTNYNGQTFAPPGANGLTMERADAAATEITFDWDEGCLGAAKYHIVSGLQSGLPAAPGGTYTLQPAGAGQCGIDAPPETLSGIGTPDPNTFYWYLVLADNGATLEGSWGKDSFNSERRGPVGLSGVSGQCGMTNKSVVNTCGQ